MNKYLPEKDLLLPITDPTSIFYPCNFNVHFDKLSFKKELEIANDIVRQTIYTDSRPNVCNHTKTLIGNCHTSSEVAIDYLKFLGLGKNHRYALARVKNHEPEETLNKHGLVLVDDNNGNTYQFDATPYVGYNYGKVSSLKEETFYKEYVVVTSDIKFLLDQIKILMLDARNDLINSSNIRYYNNIVYEASLVKSLMGYAVHCAKILLNYDQSYEDEKKLRMLIALNDVHSKLNSNYERNIKYKSKLLMMQIAKWKEELNDLIRSKTDFKRILELQQLITQELCLVDEFYQKKIFLKDKEYHLSHLTPRFFLENDIYNIDSEEIDFCKENYEFYQDYPEHKILTRFMYPNPKLKIKKEN